MYRGTDSDGHMQGGPMFYITQGMGKWAKPMAIFFSVCGLFGFLGVFTAWILTVILTSGLNHNKFTGRSSDSVGLESLRFFTYFRAVSYNIRFWWKECKIWIEG